MHFSSSLISLAVVVTLLAITFTNASPIPASLPQEHDSQSVITASNNNNNNNNIPKPCLTACPMIYMPVCGKNKNGDRKTFGNSCTLGVYNCEHPNDNYKAISQTACEEEKPCLTACPMIYMPVCGKNKNGEKKTFSNGCILGVYNCEHPNDSYKAISQTACEEKPG